MWRTFSVFSKTTNSLIAVASMPISAQAAFGSAMKRALKRRIDPRAGDQLGAVRRRARFLIVDLALNIFLGDHALFDQQIANRVDPFGMMTQFVLRMLVTMFVASAE